jgi:hypothetical protein
MRSNGPKVLGWSVAAVGLLRIAVLSRCSDMQLAKYVPDDAFYYLQSARNFARLGRWTFDGVEPASGFHLLWGYLLAALFRINPSASFHSIFVAGALFQLGLLAAAAYLTARVAVSVSGPGAVLGVATLFFSGVCVSIAGWLMETPLVIAGAACTVFLLARPEMELTPRRYAAAGALGFALMLTRSDTGLLPLVFLLAHFVMWRSKSEGPSMLKVSASVLLGSVMGLFGTVLHTHAVSGHWFQSSARQKMFWSHVQGNSFRPAFGIIRSIFDPFALVRTPHRSAWLSAHIVDRLGTTISLVMLALIVWALINTIRQIATGFKLGILGALLATCAGYVVFYRFDSGSIQGWYIANFLVPLGILVGAAGVQVFRASVVLRGVMIFFMIAAVSVSLDPIWPNQEPTYRAGMYLRAHPEVAPVAAFNAGMMGFYADRGLINVDGLVNDSILPYTQRGELIQYFAKRHIGYLVDSPQMFFPQMASRGGYGDGALEKCVAASTVLFPDDPDDNHAGVHFREYRFDPVCLQKSSEGK